MKILILFLASLILITACVNTNTTKTSTVIKDQINENISQAPKEQAPLCNSPYIEFKNGECCLDSNSNKICDLDETKQNQTTTNPSSSDPILDKAVANLIAKGVDATEIDTILDSKVGERIDLWLYAPSSDINTEHVKLGFIELYNLPNKYDFYAVHMSNGKNKNSQRKLENCDFWAYRIDIKNALGNDIDWGVPLTSYC